jgi:hypothetical protein
MVQAATRTENNRERPFIKEDLTLGYVLADKDRIAASHTLEYASDDFAISQFARRWMVFHPGRDCDCIVSTLQMTVGDRDVLTTVEVEAVLSLILNANISEKDFAAVLQMHAPGAAAVERDIGDGDPAASVEANHHGPFALLNIGTSSL